jgi:hypothetical protein
MLCKIGGLYKMGYEVGTQIPPSGTGFEQTYRITESRQFLFEWVDQSMCTYQHLRYLVFQEGNKMV